MSEHYLREQKFTYSSNLVIQREHGPRQDEPTGEPESLVGRINPREMGGLAQRDKLQRVRKEPTMQLKKAVHIELAKDLILPTNDNLLYRPKTKENRVVYEKVLSIVYSLMQEQSQDVIKSVADEILAIMKGESTDKRIEVEAIVGKLTNELYSDIVNSTKAITDYNPDIDGSNSSEVQVPLNLDESSQSSDNEELMDQEDSDSEGGEAIKTTLQEARRQKLLNIDGYWLQAELNKIYNDPVQCKELETQVLQILSAPTDIECENQLVALLSHDHFDVIKLLHANRKKIYFCTLLGQAQTAEQIEDIHGLMRQTQDGLTILAELQARKRNENTFQIGQIEEEIHKNLIETTHITDQEFQSLNKQQVDLETLTFQPHFMSNEKCHLPPHSFKVSKKGYEEIYIPAPKTAIPKESLIPIADIPEYAQAAFKGIKELNTIQSAVYQQALHTSENMLICAPTGAGKTNIALLTMLQVIGQYYQQGNVDVSKFKIIYIAPMKALVNEMVLNFQMRLEPYGIKVAEVTGDTHVSKYQLSHMQVLIATPEKWDIITRKSQQNDFIQLVRLLIIDEIHLLHDSRGPVIEAIVARTIRSIEERQEQVRIVGLSATLPNYSDVASFIRAKQTGVFFFDNSFRPVPLQQQYIGITEKKPIRRMMLMNEILYEKVSERAGKSQILIFVHSRKETVKTAKTLKEMAFAKDQLGKFLREDSSSKKILEDVLAREDIRSPDLKEMLGYGFAIHHAGLSRSDRDLVESLFEKKHIQVLISTATLAWGVNLPAHTVIIKGTQVYSPDHGRWVELSPQDILQMMGRAGRPKYDVTGEGIIITSYQELKYYLSLLNMQLPIESQFIQNLTDQLNAEITGGTVRTLKEAVSWMGYTYLYVRMLRNPTLYNVPDIANDPLLVRFRADLAHSAACLLDRHLLAKYDRKTGALEPTVLGRIACNYYVKYPSMAIYNQHMKPNMGMIDIMKVFSLSQEFKQIMIRDEEKVELSKLMMSVPVPIKGSADDPTTKINVLLQAYVSRLKLEGFALNADMIYVTQSAGRIMRAMYEISLKKEWAQTALQCLGMSKMIDKRMWGCMTPLRQFKGIPEELLRRIEKKEGITWDHLYSMSVQQLGEMVRYQNQATTKLIHKYIHKFPKIEIQAFAQPITRSCLRIDLQLSCDFQWDEKIHLRQEKFNLFVLDCDSERILYHEEFGMKQNSQQQQFTLTVPLFEIMHPLYFIRVVSDRWLSCESEQPIPFKNLMLPEPFLRCTELLQLSAVTLEAVRFPQIENVMGKRLSRTLDPIQSQVFPQLYQSQENFFLGSPSYASKNMLPHLAILQVLQTQQGYKSVYISPIVKNCENKFNDFVAIFAKQLSLKVGMLTGQIASDAKLLDQCDIIVATAQNWDILTRRWRARKGFRDIRLIVADDLHLVGEPGAILEVVMSRMRMISMECQFRIVGLSLSVADYKEMAEWLGARHVFNFAPTTRCNNIQISISSYDNSNRPLRVQMMVRQVKQLLSNCELNIIYVADRKQARVCALELMVNSETKLDLDTTGCMDQYLQHTLPAGIGYLYECIEPTDEQCVLSLIQQLKCVVITHKLALNYNLRGQVFILDNQKYDGLEKRYVDYSIPEMLEMVETAQEVCHVMTYAPKKEYYKKFLFEPIPVESHLNHYLGNHLNAEIVAKNIHNTQDCIDWITWTFMYRRLINNPNYYNLNEITGIAVNNYLSELIESTIEELHESKCIAVEEDNELEAINSGIIANYYYINVQTVRKFADNITSTAKLRDLLFILAEAQEFEAINIRNGEETLLAQIANRVPFSPQANKLNEPNTKALLLLQSHFSRIKLNADLKSDLQILELAIRLSTAMVDVASSNLWLKPAILCMNLCQMIVQAMWKDDDSPLLQLPHFTKETIDALRHVNVNDLADFMNMEDDDRNKILSQFNQTQVEQIAQASNRYPPIEIKQIVSEAEAIQGEVFHVQIVLERQDDMYSDFVIAPHYPKPKEEQWWVLCADRKSNRLFGNKKVGFRDFTKVDLRFQAPEAGEYEMTIFAICDSYIGADQSKTFELNVKPIIEVEFEQQ